MTDADNNPSPSGERSDELHLRERAQAGQPSPVARLVQDLLADMNAFGDDADERYQATLKQLRKHPEEAVIELARSESDCHAGDYPTRWALTYAATTLEHRAALPLLKSTVSRPIPPEQNDDPHASTVAEETIIRTTAVDGVGALARKGDEDALDALVEFVDLPSFSIRRAAIQAILASPKGDDLRGRLKKCLPKDERFLLDLKRIDVADAPQVEDPREHLSEAGREARKAASPDLQERSRTETAAKQRAEASREAPPETKGDDGKDDGGED